MFTVVSGKNNIHNFKEKWKFQKKKKKKISDLRCTSQWLGRSTHINSGFYVALLSNRSFKNYWYKFGKYIRET